MLQHMVFIKSVAVKGVVKQYGCLSGMTGMCHIITFHDNFEFNLFVIPYIRTHMYSVLIVVMSKHITTANFWCSRA